MPRDPADALRPAKPRALVVGGMSSQRRRVRASLGESHELTVAASLADARRILEIDPDYALVCSLLNSAERRQFGRELRASWPRLASRMWQPPPDVVARGRVGRRA